MSVTKARIRKLALALEGASEVVHVDRPAFRTKRKIFATLPPDAQAVNLMFDRATQEFFCEQALGAMAPHPAAGGAWASRFAIRAADEALAIPRSRLRTLAQPNPPGKEGAGGVLVITSACKRPNDGAGAAAAFSVVNALFRFAALM